MAIQGVQNHDITVTVITEVIERNLYPGPPCIFGSRFHGILVDLLWKINHLIARLDF